MQSLFRQFRRLFSAFETSSLRVALLYGAAIGVPAALIGIVFNQALELVQHATLTGIAGFTPPAPGGEAGAPFVAPASWITPALLILLPALGGLVGGYIVHKLAPEAEGDGLDHAISAYHHKRGNIRARVPLVKVLTSAITIGAGGSAGREGPIAQIGAGIGSMLGRWLKLSDRDRRTLVLCGTAAGIGAIFKAPLGGALFAAEVLYREPEFEYEALIPCFVAAIVSYSCYCTFSGMGWGAIFTLPEQPQFQSLAQLPLYAALALFLVLFGRLYIGTFFGFQRLVFRPMRLHKALKCALGGLLAGAVAFLFWAVALLLPGDHNPADFVGAVLGMGYGYVQWAIDGRAGFGMLLMLLLALTKILTTSLTISSGGSGGAFAPSLVIGGLAGGAFGHFCHMLFPDLVGADQISAFVLVGMGGFFAGVAKVPLAAMIMALEMTSGYGLLAPLMLVVALTYVLMPRKASMYESQLDLRIDSPAHTGDFITDVLEDLQVGGILREGPIVTIPENAFLSSILRQATQSRQTSFPVVDEEGAVTGLISLNDLRSAFLEPELGSLVIARDIAHTGQEMIFADESLNVALRKMIGTQCEELPVVDRDQENRLVGMLGRRELIVAYNREMQRRIELRDEKG